VSLKRTAAEKKSGADFAPTSDGDDYPWGLRINLSDEEIKKLGLTMPEIGTELSMEAVAKVVSVSERSNTGGKSRSVEIIITDMALGPKPADKSHADVLYG
jgi:hypothetical protein